VSTKILLVTAIVSGVSVTRDTDAHHADPLATAQQVTFFDPTTNDLLETKKKQSDTLLNEGMG
jgi:hypothetical protein